MRKCRASVMRLGGAALLCGFAISAQANPSRHLKARSTSCGEPSLHPGPDYCYQPISPAAYPEGAKRLGHEGTPVVMAILDGDGNVTRAGLYQPSGYIELDAAAVKLVKGRQFSACPKTHVPRNECYVTIPVVFKLHQQ